MYHTIINTNSHLWNYFTCLTYFEPRNLVVHMAIIWTPFMSLEMERIQIRSTRSKSLGTWCILDLYIFKPLVYIYIYIYIYLKITLVYPMYLILSMIKYYSRWCEQSYWPDMIKWVVTCTPLLFFFSWLLNIIYCSLALWRVVLSFSICKQADCGLI